MKVIPALAVSATVAALSIGAAAGFAQPAEAGRYKAEVSSSAVFNVVNDQAGDPIKFQYPSGDTKLYKWLHQRSNYPDTQYNQRFWSTAPTSSHVIKFRTKADDRCVKVTDGPGRIPNGWWRLKGAKWIRVASATDFNVYAAGNRHCDGVNRWL